MIHRAFIFRANRKHGFPFDKMYFFRKDQEDFLPKIFNVCYYFPIGESFRSTLSRLYERTLQGRRNTSGVKTVGKIYPVNRGDEHRIRESAKDHNPMKMIIDSPNSYIYAVPILFTRKTGVQDKMGPKYFGVMRRKGSRYSSSKTRETNNALDNHSEGGIVCFGQKLQPICVACPNYLLSLTNRCTLMSSDCMRNFGHPNPRSFRRAMERACDITRGEQWEDLQKLDSTSSNSTS